MTRCLDNLFMKLVVAQERQFWIDTSVSLIEIHCYHL